MIINLEEIRKKSYIDTLHFLSNGKLLFALFGLSTYDT